MKRFLLTGVLCTLAAFALAQVMPFPGPGGIAAPPCQSNAINGTFANVIGLWHFDNNGTDQASTPHSITLSGAAAYSNTQSKFGGYSLKITTTISDYGTINATGISIAGDFTAEGWMYQTATYSYTGMMGDDVINFGVLANPNLSMYAPGLVSIPTISWLTMFGANAWHHVAWVRASSVFHFYYDGADQGNIGSSGTISGTSTWRIGRTYSGTYGMASNSYLDELRLSNVARYTANFTPPTQPFCNN